MKLFLKLILYTISWGGIRQSNTQITYITILFFIQLKQSTTICYLLPRIKHQYLIVFVELLRFALEIRAPCWFKICISFHRVWWWQEEHAKWSLIGLLFYRLLEIMLWILAYVSFGNCSMVLDLWAFLKLLYGTFKNRSIELGLWDLSLVDNMVKKTSLQLMSKW